jgi:hypothetical protein
MVVVQVARLPGDASLLPKVHINLGITLEGQGCLLEACSHYRCEPPPADQCILLLKLPHMYV